MYDMKVTGRIKTGMRVDFAMGRSWGEVSNKSSPSKGDKTWIGEDG